MAYHVHIFDDTTRTDIVVPIDAVLAAASNNQDPDDVVHGLIDAARADTMAAFKNVRGWWTITNWYVGAEFGGLVPNTWHTVPLTSQNTFSPDGKEGFQPTGYEDSFWVCRETGWYDLFGWMRGSISPPAVPLALLTCVSLGFQVKRHPKTPQAYLQLATLDAQSIGGTIVLGDDYADCQFNGGAPPTSTQNHLRKWGVSGAAHYPLYVGDEVRLVWMFEGVGIDWIDWFQARLDIHRVESLATRHYCCSGDTL